MEIQHYLLFLSCLSTLFLFSYTLKLRRNILSFDFALFALASSVYAFGYAFELTSSDLEVLSLNNGCGGELSLNSGENKQYFKLSMQELSGTNRKKIGIILTFHDITEQKKLMQDLHMLATHDSLTCILNRRQLELQADEALYSAKTSGRNRVAAAGV